MAKNKAKRERNLRGKYQARWMAFKINASEIATFVITIISLLSIVGDVGDLVDTLTDSSGTINRVKLAFSATGLIISTAVFFVSIVVIALQFYSLSQKSKVYFPVDEDSYREEVLARLESIIQRNAKEAEKGAPIDELIKVKYDTDPYIRWNEDYYIYNAAINRAILDDKLNDVICVLSPYKYKIPNITKPVVPYVLNKDLSSGKTFFNGPKLRLCSELYDLIEDPKLSEEQSNKLNNAKKMYNDDTITGKVTGQATFIYVNKTSQFNTLCTNDLAMKKIRCIEKMDEEYQGDKLFIEDEIHNRASVGNPAVNRYKEYDLCRYDESSMSNQIGCSSLLFTSDNKVVIRKQDSKANNYARMNVPSSSCAVEYNSHRHPEKGTIVYLTKEEIEKKIQNKVLTPAFRGKHIVNFAETLRYCVKKDLNRKLKITPDYVKIIGFFKVVERGNLPDFSCLSYTKLTAEEVKAKALGPRVPVPGNKSAVPESKGIWIFDVDLTKPDGGLLKTITENRKNQAGDTYDDCVSIQLHAILKVLSDNKDALQDFLKEAREQQK